MSHSEAAAALCSIRASARSAMPPLARVLPFVRRDASVEVCDAELVQLARQGRRDAQRALYERHFDALLGRVRRLLGRDEEAEDVLQDSFVEAFRDLHRLEDPARLRGWLMRIAVHQVHRRFRRRRLLRAIGFERRDDERLSAVADASANPVTLVLLRQMDRALHSLPSRQQLAWLLRHLEGCELSDIAEQCDCSLATIKRTLLEAERALAAHIDWQWAPQPGDPNG
jgi:RNA polymerase sigma-70 factor, ECF subfamily